MRDDKFVAHLVGWLATAVMLFQWLALTLGWIGGEGHAYQYTVLGVSILYGYMNVRLRVWPAVAANVFFIVLCGLTLLGVIG
jgi:hypothetical protein